MSGSSKQGVDESEIQFLEQWQEPALLLVVSAPSGAGKSTICRRILQDAPAASSCERGLVFSVSTTTRTPRPDEVDGEDYHFVDESAFDQMVQNDEFLEWAQVHGEYYGTSRASVERALEENNDVLLEIDVQGAEQVKEHCESAVLVFIAPPSLEELERRLHNRDTESQDEIELRLREARQEMQAVDQYDYVVINDRIDRAVSRLESIRLAEKCKLNRQKMADQNVLPTDQAD